MATVPIQTTPTQQLSGAGLPAISSGGAAAPIMQDVAGKQAQATGKMLSDVGDVMINLQDMEDDATVKEADNFLLERLTEVDIKYKEKLGRNAVDGYSGAEKEVADAYKEAQALVRNSRQEALLSAVATKRLLATRTSMAGHQLRQREVWLEGVDVARTKLNADNAVKLYIAGDLKGHGEALNTAVDGINSRVARGTLSKEEGDVEKLNITSGVMSGIVDNMLANEQYGLANKFAAKNKDLFTAGAYNDKVALARNGLERQAGIGAADRFLKQANGDTTAALQLVWGSELPPTKQASAIAQIMQVKKANKAAKLLIDKAYNDNRLQAWSVIASSPGDPLAVRKIPTSVSNHLNSDDVTALINGFNTYDDQAVIDRIQAHQNMGSEHWDAYVMSGQLINDAMRKKADGTPQLMLTKEGLFGFMGTAGANVGNVSYDESVFRAGVMSNGLKDLLDSGASDKDKQKLYNLKVIYKEQLRDRYKGVTPTIKQQQEVLNDILTGVKKQRRFGIPVSVSLDFDAPWWDLDKRLKIDRGYETQTMEEVLNSDPIRFSKYITALKAAGLEPTSANIYEMYRKDTGK